MDNNRIDQRALAPSKEVSEERLLKTDANGQYAIKGNIREVCFLPRGDIWTVRHGTMSMQSNDRRSRERRIGVDMSKAIEDTEKELHQIEAEHRDLDGKANDLARQHKGLKVDWNTQKKKERDNQDTIATLARKKEEIEMERESTNAEDIDTSELEEDVQKCEEELEQAKQKETDLRKELTELEPAVIQAQDRLVEVATRNEKVLDDMRKAEENLERCMSRLSQQTEKLQKKRDRLNQFQEIISKHQAKVGVAKKERNRALYHAKKLTLRQQRMEQAADNDEGLSPEEQLTEEDVTEEELAGVEIQTVPKESKAYEAKINRAIAKIKEERKKRKTVCEGDKEEVATKYYRAKEILSASDEALEKTQRVIHDLEKDMRNRHKRHNELHRHLGVMIDSKFDEMLDFNGASGNVEFDEEGKELHLVVQKDKNDSGSQTRDVNSLR